MMRTVSALAASGEKLEDMEEADRASRLRELLGVSDPLPTLPEDLPEDSRRVLETFDRIRLARDEFSELPVETFVLSMAHYASDVLSVQLLARRAGLLEVAPDGRCTANYLRITPLFETVEDLKRAPAVLRNLLEDPFYRSSLSQSRVPAGDNARVQRLR